MDCRPRGLQPLPPGAEPEADSEQQITIRVRRGERRGRGRTSRTWMRPGPPSTASWPP